MRGARRPARRAAPQARLVVVVTAQGERARLRRSSALKDWSLDGAAAGAGGTGGGGGGITEATTAPPAARAGAYAASTGGGVDRVEYMMKVAELEDAVGEQQARLAACERSLPRASVLAGLLARTQSGGGANGGGGGGGGGFAGTPGVAEQQRRHSHTTRDTEVELQLWTREGPTIAGLVVEYINTIMEDRATPALPKRSQGTSASD